MVDREDKLRAWAADQRALARALGLSIAEWLSELEAAGERRTGLTAAVIGAATASGLGLAILDRLDGAALVRRARELVDPEPPQVESPVIAEAIRRAGEVGVAEGRGARRLKGNVPRETATNQLPSSGQATPDAPGGEEEP